MMERHQSEILGVCWYNSPDGWFQAAIAAEQIGWHSDAAWLREAGRDLKQRQTMELYVRVACVVLIAGALLLSAMIRQ